MSSCPACNKEVDPRRSRFVGVVDGKVVGFCSPECAARGAPTSAAHITGRVVAVASAAAAASDAMLARVPAGPQTPATGVPVMLGEPRPSGKLPASLESGPVIEVIREPGSAGVAQAKDDRSGRAKHPDEISMAAFWTADKEREKSGLTKLPADKPAVKAVADDPPAAAKPATAKPVAAKPVAAKPVAAELAEPEPDVAPPRKSRLPLVLILLIIAGLGGFALYRMLTKGNAEAATSSSMREVRQPERVAAVEGQGRRPFDPAPGAREAPGAADQAHDVLVRGLSATSPRIQHLAAAALARTQDPAARASLVAQLGRETSEIAKLDLAYALARGGDPQGRELLAAGLRSIRGEVRDEAARLLALLGDKRAIPHLLDLLAVPQRHLGGAEQLARLAEPHGIGALQQLLADPRAPADEKARATIALGLAGALAPDALRALLADPHQNMFAAAALAERRDPAATDVLVDQLASPALRVRAARALRRLDPTPGATTASAARLPALVAALGQGSDPYQISAAEAILLLTGPAAWADRE